MCTLELHCQSCGYDWFGNEPYELCPRCKSNKTMVSGWDDEYDVDGEPKEDE